MPWPTTTTLSVFGSGGRARRTPKAWRKSSPLLKKSVRLDPKLGVAYLQLGILYSDRKDFSPRDFRVSGGDRGQPAAAGAGGGGHYRLAQAYRRTGEKSKAEQELQLYDQLSKKNAEEIERRAA